MDDFEHAGPQYRGKIVKRRTDVSAALLQVENERLRAAQDAVIRVLSDDRLPIQSRVNDARAILARAGGYEQSPQTKAEG